MIDESIGIIGKIQGVRASKSPNPKNIATILKIEPCLRVSTIFASSLKSFFISLLLTSLVFKSKLLE